MDVSDRLQYSFAGPEDDRDECDKAFWIKSSLDRNIGSTLRFVIPPDPEAFTDVNVAYMSVTLRVVKADGNPLDESDLVFVSPGSLQSLFDSCQIFLNGASLEPSNAYSFGATLTSYLGMAKTTRDNVWKELAGMRTPNFTSSKILPSNVGDFREFIKTVALSKPFTLTGRLMSDFMQSCGQLLPPGIKLEVNLRRSPDSFTLCSVSEDQSLRYRVEIGMASLFLRRVRMRKPILERTLKSIENGGRLAYTRMDCVISQIPATGVFLRFGNIYGGRELPHTLYLVLANQKAFSGAQDYLGNYFESGYLQSVQVFENGRPVLTQPIRTTYAYDADGVSLNTANSDAAEPFLTCTQAMNGIANSQMVAGLSYFEFLRGCIVTCVQLNSCGGKQMGAGFVDVELMLTDNDGREPMLLLVFGEYNKFVRFDANLHIVPN